MVLCLKKDERVRNAVDEVCGGDERMVCRVRGGKYRWTWHDERGRLLLEGPESRSRNQSQLLFLEAIRDYIASGKKASEE